MARAGLRSRVQTLAPDRNEFVWGGRDVGWNSLGCGTVYHYAPTSETLSSESFRKLASAIMLEFGSA